jgi:hypothetical protein
MHPKPHPRSRGEEEQQILSKGKSRPLWLLIGLEMARSNQWWVAAIAAGKLWLKAEQLLREDLVRLSTLSGLSPLAKNNTGEVHRQFIKSVPGLARGSQGQGGQVGLSQPLGLSVLSMARSPSPKCYRLKYRRKYRVLLTTIDYPQAVVQYLRKGKPNFLVIIAWQRDTGYATP